jgi:hypothetical protein
MLDPDPLIPIPLSIGVKGVLIKNANLGVIGWCKFLLHRIKYDVERGYRFIRYRLRKVFPPNDIVTIHELTCLAAIAKFKPLPFFGEVVFISTRGLKGVLGWDKVILNAIVDEVISLPHVELLDEPAMVVWTKTFNRSLLRAQQMLHPEVDIASNVET